MSEGRLPMLLVLLSVCLALTACNEDVTSTEGTVQAEYPPTRVSDPIDDVVADLEDYIPRRMREDGIPGLSIALIRNGRVVWGEGFGVTNTVTGYPITPETVFEAASISKVVTSYIALRLVEQGRLSLDDPLINHLSEPWLPSSEYGDSITLRHLASHSSGLTDRVLPLDTSITFRPGSGFLYSGVGAMYIQAAIEQASGQSLQDIAQEIVFEPLGMHSSSFVNDNEIVSRMANGHIGYLFFLLAFLVPFTVISVIIGVLGVLILRVTNGRWHLPQRMMVSTVALATVLTLLTLLVLVWNIFLNLVLLATLCAAAFATACAMMYWVGQRIIVRQHARWRTRRSRYGLSVAWMGFSIVALVWAASLISGPMPKSISPQASAVGTLRTTAGDVAALMIEIVHPEHLSDSLAAEMRTPQVSVNDDFSWGLGPGIQHSNYGDALWQNGNTPGFRSVVVMYPEQDIGVVVLTNSDHGQAAAYDVAQRALGGKALWRLHFP